MAEIIILLVYLVIATPLGIIEVALNLAPWWVWAVFILLLGGSRA